MKIHRNHIQKKQDDQSRTPANIQQDPFKYVPKEYIKVAKGLEQQFAQYMIEQMHNSIGQEEQDSSMSYYQELNQKEQAKQLTNVKNGLGLQKLILDEIYPEKFRNPEAIEAFNQHQAQAIYKRNKIEMEGPPAPAQPVMVEKNSINMPQEADHE